MPIQSYQDLIAWQKAMEVAVSIYRVTERFPKSEQYGLVSQMRRAAISVPSNIAEGTMRGTRKDYRQFVLIAGGSIAELETQLEIARRLGYLSESMYTKVVDDVAEVGRIVNGLSRRLRG